MLTIKIMDLFLLKKIISVLIMPINLIIILLLLAIIFFKSKPARSFKCLLSAFIAIVLCSVPVVSDTMMVKLEDNYETYTRSSMPVDYIVVLGGWHYPNDARPVTSQLNHASLQRLVEAFRVYKLHPEARIITSGHHSTDAVSNAEKMKLSLVLLGVPEQKIIIENFPRDTEEEAQLISPRIQGANVVLITNANHMTRAMHYFHAEGVYPLAAPTGFWVKNPDSEKNWTNYLPDINKLHQTTLVWYESLALLVQRIKELFS